MVQIDAPAMTGEIKMHTGSLALAELSAVLDALPVDITFVDANDKVRYSQSKDRVFVCATSVLGRSVQNCHPPQSLKKITEILESFRNGSRNHADFWIQVGSRFVCIRYFAVRDPQGKYLGTLEVTQDVTGIRSLSAEKRLMSDADTEKTCAGGLLLELFVAEGGFLFSRGAGQPEHPEKKPR